MHQVYIYIEEYITYRSPQNTPQIAWNLVVDKWTSADRFM